MKVFISQSMRGLAEDQILRTRSNAVKSAKNYFKRELKEGEEIEIIDSIIAENPPATNSESAWFLGKSIELLSTADRAYFVKGWSESRGCKIEFMVAKEYGIKFYCE